MNPFERIAALLSLHAEPIHQETLHNDITGEFEVKLSSHDGRRVIGTAKDLAEATAHAVDGWEKFNAFAPARALMAKTLREDEGCRIGYEANVAMVLYDNFDRADFKDKDVREDAARQILHKIFES